MAVLKETYEKLEIHDNWESIYRGHPIQDRLNDAIIERALRIMQPPQGAHFLDAGCGVGDHTFRIARHGFQVTGIDISEQILKTAEANAARVGLSGRVRFASEPLEQLSFADATFDAVHCRGVLMHIPEWEKALASLCRVLKPGGHILIMESNHAGPQTWLIRLVRAVTARQSRMVKTPGGLEFWSEENGVPFVVRIANIAYVQARLKTLGLQPVSTFATEALGIARFPAGLLRNSVIRWNSLYFALRLPARLSDGVAIIAKKSFQ